MRIKQRSGQYGNLSKDSAAQESRNSRSGSEAAHRMNGRGSGTGFNGKKISTFGGVPSMVNENCFKIEEEPEKPRKMTLYRLATRSVQDDHINRISDENDVF